MANQNLRVSCYHKVPQFKIHSLNTNGEHPIPRVNNVNSVLTVEKWTQRASVHEEDARQKQGK